MSVSTVCAVNHMAGHNHEEAASDLEAGWMQICAGSNLGHAPYGQAQYGKHGADLVGADLHLAKLGHVANPVRDCARELHAAGMVSLQQIV